MHTKISTDVARESGIALDNEVVHLSKNQTISGNKVFSGNVSLSQSPEVTTNNNQLATTNFVKESIERSFKENKVLLWLTRNKNFYVDKNTGSDTIDTGRGESESKPFKTIQACIDYVINTYCMSKYAINIIIADGVYDENLILRDFQHNNGYIYLMAKNMFGVTLRMTDRAGDLVSVVGGNWRFNGIKFEQTCKINVANGKPVWMTIIKLHGHSSNVIMYNFKISK